MEIATTATALEIKRAFRQKALLLHPDKAGNHQHNSNQFQLVKEAYQVLGNPSLRQAYDAKHLQPTNNKPRLTPHQLLQASQQLVSKLNSINPASVNYGFVLQELETWMQEQAFTELVETAALQASLQQLLLNMNACLSFLPYQQMKLTAVQILAIAKEGTSHKAINDNLLQRKNEWLWDKAKIPLALVLAILLCVGIALAA